MTITIFILIGTIIILSYLSISKYSWQDQPKNDSIQSDVQNTKPEVVSKPTEKIEITSQKITENIPQTKDIPNWLKKYQNLPDKDQFETLKKILKDNSIFPEENPYEKTANIADNLEIFPGVYQSNGYKNALELLETGYGEIVYKNMDKFQITDQVRQEEIIKISKKRNEFYFIAQNYKFFELSQTREIEIANEELNKHANDLIMNFNYFKQIPQTDHVKYSNKIIDQDKILREKYNTWSGNTCELFSFIDKFNGLTEKQKIDLFNRAYDSKFYCGREVADNFQKWNINDLNARLDIAAKIIMMGDAGFIPENISKFNLNSQQQLIIAQRIIDEKHNIDTLKEGINYFNHDIRTQIISKINQ